MLILVIGPSRSGKTTLLERVCGDVQARRFDIDAYENKAVAELIAAGGDPDGWEGRWDRVLPALIERERDESPWIVDVGAGTLQSPRARDFVRERLDRSVAVCVPFDELQRRHRRRDVEDLRRLEWSDENVALYEACPRRVDATRGLEDSAAELGGHLRQLIENRGA